MYFVDFAWPMGVFFIGAQLLISSHEGDIIRRIAIALVYIAHGGRMWFGSSFLMVKGIWSPKKPDLPRYQYAIIHFEKDGTNVVLGQVLDILA